MNSYSTVSGPIASRRDSTTPPRTLFNSGNRKMSQFGKQDNRKMSNFGKQPGRSTSPTPEQSLSSTYSQESKASITKAIRRNVASKQRLQDAADFAQLLSLKEGMQMALSVRDMVECNHIPVIGSGNFGRSASVQGGGSFRNSVGNEDLSSIMKSLKSIPRIRGPQSVSDHEFHRRQKEMGRGEILSTSDKNAKLVAASEMHKSGKKIFDGSRLIFEAGVLYDEIGMLDKAAECFERCSCHQEDAARIVDEYDLTEGVEFERKIERMATSHRRAFLQKRADLRGSLIAAEKERMRLRSMVSYCQLVRIYLQMDDYVNAHRCLVAAFHTTVSFPEHTELLLFAHDTLKEFGKHFYELSVDQQIVRGSAGPLAEAHINILHELLEEDSGNVDVLEWLGRRYAERCNFEESKMYFRRAVDLKNPVRIAVDMRSFAKARPKGIDDEAYLKNVSKIPIRQFSKGNEIDQAKIVERGDYAWPSGAHEGSDTLIYTAPAQGWEHGIKGQEDRMVMLGQSFRLPPKKTRSAGAP